MEKLCCFEASIGRENMKRKFTFERYDLMYGIEKIGDFMVHVGKFGRQFHVHLDVEDYESNAFVQIVALKTGNEIYDREVRLWFRARVVPRNRINIDKVLQELGLSEYDQWTIIKMNNGQNLKDTLWIRTEEWQTFENTHYLGKAGRPWKIAGANHLGPKMREIRQKDEAARKAYYEERKSIHDFNWEEYRIKYLNSYGVQKIVE